KSGMTFRRKFASFLLLLICAASVAMPALADDGNSAGCPIPIGSAPCRFPASEFPGGFRDSSRPGSVIVFPKFVKGSGSIAACDAGNLLANTLCTPRTEIELGAVRPTRFTTGSQSEANFPCAEHQSVKVRFRWV